MQEKCPNDKINRLSQGEPTPTGRAFIEWCNKYRKRHPNSFVIPFKLLEQYWIRSAQENNNSNLLQSINATRVKNGQKRV
jgi:hypothetical protein